MLKFIINLILSPYNLWIKFYHECILDEDLFQDRNGECIINEKDTNTNR